MGFFSGGGLMSSPPVNYEWYEEKTILQSNNSFVLGNAVPEGGELLIINKEYGLVFTKDIHWNRVNQVISFIEDGFDENMEFQIYCFKKEEVV